ncbi:MAG TPA: hypothetical protein VNY52_04705 [Solirubrobacteraceae bacterium]|jgi:hypothetical protein|nr:hypothetical protein [Solirubrobacteraceae bacterium]
MSPTASTDDSPSARLASAARAAEELCGALWEALHDELRQPGAPQAQAAAALAERLAEICSMIAELASRLGRLPEPTLEPPVPEETEIEIHDARKEEAGEPTRKEEAGEPPRKEEAGEPTKREGPIAGADAIGRSVERHTVDTLPFAVLLVEIVDVERLAQAESPVELTHLVDRMEEALRPELRPADAIVRESPGRWWVTASRTDAHGARALAERLAHIARTAASHRGIPLELAVGVAVCPANGQDSATLAAHADVGLYAARAAGQPVGPVEGAA